MRKICIELETDSEESLEAIKQDLKMEMSCCYNNFDIVSIKEVALHEHNTSEDLISRQEAIKIAESYGDDVYRSIEKGIVEDLKDLPSIQLASKTGRWSYKDIDEYWGDWYECSECGGVNIPGKYCADCGAKMIGGDDT